MPQTPEMPKTVCPIISCKFLFPLNATNKLFLKMFLQPRIYMKNIPIFFMILHIIGSLLLYVIRLKNCSL